MRAGDADAHELARPESIEGLEAVFQRLMPLVREQLRAFAEQIHPGLRPASMQVLRAAIQEHRASDGGAIAVGDIIQRTSMDKSVVSRQLRQLSAWGLVTTRRSAQDGRVILVEASPLALERFDAARAAVRERNARILVNWPESDVRELTRLLERWVSDREG